jgi:histidinol-phosphate aminotransferase
LCFDFQDGRDPMPPKFTDLADSLPASVPFVGPETHERQMGKPFQARLGANESIFGPSPKAIEAMSEAAANAWMYCDPENYNLRHALAAHHGVAAENIVVGEGIDGLLGLTCRLFLSNGTPVVTSAGAYPTFNFHVAGFGGTLHTVPYKNDCEDPDTLLNAADETGARLVYIANPDNPMGTVHDAATIQRMIDQVPSDALLCLDEAYIEFADPGTAPVIDITNPNVIRFRTFSKAYGMAGARIGYAIAEANLATAFNKVRNHFGVSRISQAGALAALNDQVYLDSIQKKVIDARAKISDIATANGLQPLSSQTNFVTIDCGQDGDFARRVLSNLIEMGVFVRMPGVEPLDRCIRVTVGRDEDITIFADALPKALAAANSET